LGWNLGFIYIPLEHAMSRTVEVVNQITRRKWDLRRQFYILTGIKRTMETRGERWRKANWKNI